MKKVYNYLIALTVLLFGATSCTDVLDKEPVDSAKIEDVFSDLGLAKAWLGNCYDKIGGDGGVLGMREDLLASNTDQCLCIHRPSDFKFVKGSQLSADALGHIGGSRFGFLNWGRLYSNIQNVNTFLANIDKVPTDITTEAQIPQMKGEAYFIRAYDYSQLLFTYGGVVLSDKPFDLDEKESFGEITRSSLQETMDFILADVAQAIALLPAKMEQGRATRAAAAALKSRLILFCASDLVNGGYEPTNPLVSFTSFTPAERTARWTAARDAAKDIIDGDYGAFTLVGETTDPPSPLTAQDVKRYSDNYFNLFVQKSGAWNSESIWGIQYNITGGNTQRINIWNGPNGYHNWGNNDPTEPAVRKFEMQDGTPFVWDVYNPGNQVLRTATAAELAADPYRSPYYGREPRFYATVLYHGAPWQQRPTDAAGLDPLNIVQTGHFYNDDGTLKANGLDTRQSLIEAWNGTKNGYYLKKFMDPLSQGQFFNNTNSWIEYRYAEILLNYAEACIELGGADLQNGIDALNMVRNRAGLPDRVTADQATARDYLRHERYIEFFAEGHQWYDMRRWMTAAALIENVYEMKIKQFTNGNMEWRIDLAARADQRSFVTRNYWTPLPRDEMNKAPQLTQNPGF